MQARRRLRHEPLEDRRLLTTLEGDAFALPTQALDPVGFLGDLSAQIDWGDGSSTAVDVDSPNNPNGVRIRFDYSLDDNNFFNSSARRALLQQAADTVTQYFGDSLAAIVPSGSNTWTPRVRHPSQGASNQFLGPRVDVNLNSVAANEIVVYAGARDFIGSVRGVGATGSSRVVGSQAWLDLVESRGQAGVLASTPTDYSIFAGSVSFDTSGTNWYFDSDIDGIETDEIDFYTVAVHELSHVLGFGLGDTWENLTAGGTFNGPQARAAYAGSGAPPVTSDHWAVSVGDLQQTVLTPVVDAFGRRQILGRLDLAALDDIGWDVTYPSVVQVNGSHTYGDNGDFDVTVTLEGSQIGQAASNDIVADINNVAPSLTVPPAQTVTVGNSLSLPANLWEISDPGFNSGQTQETFTYTIDWQDGSDLETGNAVVTTVGSEGQDTIANLAVSHTFTEEGTFDVSVTVQDDDGGTVSDNFQVSVVARPAISLSLDNQTVAENAGDSAATLTVTRSGPTLAVDQTISLNGSDGTEINLPSTVVIEANMSSATVQIDAVDDTLLDGTKSVTITAGVTGVEGDSISLDVTDFESLTAEILVSGSPALGVLEGRPGEVVLRLSRSNTDNAQPLDVSVSGGDPAQLEVQQSLQIPANASLLNFDLVAVDDEIAEVTQSLDFDFQAAGYASANLEIRVFDDEQSAFQNPQDQFDVDNANGVTAIDALQIINRLSLGVGELNPVIVPFDDAFIDTTGDYQLTARDVLIVINELANRQFGESEGEGERILARAAGLASTDALFASIIEESDDDDETLSYDWMEISIV